MPPNTCSRHTACRLCLRTPPTCGDELCQGGGNGLLLLLSIHQGCIRGIQRHRLLLVAVPAAPAGPGALGTLSIRGVFHPAQEELHDWKAQVVWARGPRRRQRRALLSKQPRSVHRSAAESGVVKQGLRRCLQRALQLLGLQQEGRQARRPGSGRQAQALQLARPVAARMQPLLPTLCSMLCSLCCQLSSSPAGGL